MLFFRPQVFFNEKTLRNSKRKMSSGKPSSPRTTAGNVIFFKSPIWDHFKLCEDRKVAECQKCGEQITRCGQSAKRPRLDNLRKHLLNVHDINIPTVVGMLS